MPTAPIGTARVASARTGGAMVSRTRRSGATWSFRVPRAASKEDNGKPEAGTPSIDSKSLWRLRLELFSGKDADATTPDRTITVRAKFVVDEGYEPPQGSIEIEDDQELAFVQAGFHRWTLAECVTHPAAVAKTVPATFAREKLTKAFVYAGSRTSARLGCGSGACS